MLNIPDVNVPRMQRSGALRRLASQAGLTKEREN